MQSRHELVQPVVVAGAGIYHRQCASKGKQAYLPSTLLVHPTRVTGSYDRNVAKFSFRYDDVVIVQSNLYRKAGRVVKRCKGFVPAWVDR